MYTRRNFLSTRNQIANTLQEITVIYDINYIVNKNGTLSVTDNRGFDGTDLVLASEYNGMPVTTIEANAFAGCDTILTVEIPDSIVHIGEGAFS